MARTFTIEWKMASNKQHHQLTINNLWDVYQALISIAHKFKVVGLGIGIPSNELEDIDKDNRDSKRKLYSMLRYRLRQEPLLTWENIVRALRSPGISESALASEIENKYLLHFSSLPVPRTSVLSVSHNYGQPPTPGPPPKRPRLDPSASARQQSVPIPSSSSSSMPVASPTPTPQVSIQPSTPHSVQSVANYSSVSKVYSEAMQNFIHYVKNIYRSRKVETYVKFSLNPTKVFINLALIDRHVVEHKEYKDITVAMVQDGNVDAIQKKKGQIELNKIACGIPDPSSGSDSEEDRRLILVEGAPGVGKSTFAWEYCRRWLHGSVAQQYDLVLLLRLRDERIKSAKDLKDLLYIPLPGISEQVQHDLVMGKYNVLLILEGFDELPDSSRKDPYSIFNELISGELLPLATILVTSRPWVTEDIRRKHDRQLFQHIEVLGFTKSQINEYIKKTVPAEKVSDITSYLERHPQIRSGMYIPLNSAIVVAVYLASEKGTQDLPKTQTELYTSLVDILIARHMESHPKLKGSIKVDLPSLGISVPSEIYQNFIHLSKIAYKGIAYKGIAYKGIVESGDEVKLIFSESELPLNFDNLGFMDSVTDLYVNQQTKSSHNFLHLTFQEFFAAAHISTMPSEKQREYYRESIGKKGGRLKVVLRFLAGLKKLDCFTNESAMLITEQSDHKPRSEFRSPPECMIGIDVVNWTFEAQSEDKISLILGERKVEFKAAKISMLPMDYYSLGYCISHSQCQWVLSLTGKMAISKEKIGILAEGATESGFTGRIVELGDDVLIKLSKEVLNSLFEKWIIFLSLELYIEKREFNDTALLPIQSMPVLKVLRFQNTEMSNKTANYLIQFLQSTGVLIQFSLLECKVPARELMQILQTVQQNTVIRESEVHDCKVSITCDDDVTSFNQLLHHDVLEKEFVKTIQEIISSECKCIADIVRNRKTIDVIKGRLKSDVRPAIESLFQGTYTSEELNISSSMINDDGTDLFLGVLAMALQLNSTLLILDISWNDIGDDGAIALSQYLVHNSSLTKLILRSNNIHSTGAAALAEALTQNSTLLHLDLRSNEFGDEGVKSLAEALAQNSTLLHLVLLRNKIGDEGVKSLAEALAQNSTLLHLDLSWNKIGGEGVKSLAEALTQNSTLEELNLSLCEFGDEGAMALSVALHKNSSLKLLNVEHNDKIGNRGHDDLVAATDRQSIHLIISKPLNLLHRSFLNNV